MKSIEEFIEDMYSKLPDTVENPEECQETIRNFFHNGYCYYFAKMLETAYPGGEVCLTFPFAHFVYKYNGKYYDVEGEYGNEDVEYFIPEMFLGDSIKDFLHNGTAINTSKEQMQEIKELYEVGSMKDCKFFEITNENIGEAEDVSNDFERYLLVTNADSLELNKFISSKNVKYACSNITVIDSVKELLSIKHVTNESIVFYDVRRK